jgi:hypothetical protein
LDLEIQAKRIFEFSKKSIDLFEKIEIEIQFEVELQFELNPQDRRSRCAHLPRCHVQDVHWSRSIYYPMHPILKHTSTPEILHTHVLLLLGGMSWFMTLSSDSWSCSPSAEMSKGHGPLASDAIHSTNAPHRGGFDTTQSLHTPTGYLMGSKCQNLCRLLKHFPEMLLAMREIESLLTLSSDSHWLRESYLL